MAKQAMSPPLTRPEDHHHNQQQQQQQHFLSISKSFDRMHHLRYRPEVHSPRPLIIPEEAPPASPATMNSQDPYEARASIDGWTPKALTPKAGDCGSSYSSFNPTPRATPQSGTPRGTPGRKSTDGERPRMSVSSMLGGLVEIVGGRKSGRLGDEDELQGNAYYEEVMASRASNASPLRSPGSAISMALPFQTADLDLAFNSDVEAARHAAPGKDVLPDMDKHIIIERTSYPISLKFVEVKYSIALKKQEKEILHGITGSVAPGEMLAMMGPSGSGKTTLLNVLGARVSGNISGTITYNDQPYNRTLKRRIGFVTQDDILYPHLTVRETLMYAALLRLPKDLKKHQKIQRADEVIQQLRLDKCKDTIIGSAVMRGVSGGERKRVCISHEILIDPSLIFLDEPTSGLDSTTALLIVQILQSIAVQGGRTIITTIHQPSSRMFHMFDKLILLSEGCPIFFGKAMDTLNYFSAIGFKPLIPMNPAEFLLDLCSGNTNDVSVPRLLEQTVPEEPLLKPSAENVKQYLIDSCCNAIASREQKVLSAVHEKHDMEKFTEDRREWMATWWEQFVVLLERGFKERRHEYLSPLKVIQVVAVSVICGLLYWQSKANTFVRLQDQAGLIFFFAVFWSFIPCSTAIFTFPLERAMLAKERSSDMYRLSAYFMARNLGDLPLDLILPIIFVFIVYFMAHLKMTATAFFLTMISVFLIIITSQGVGLFIGAAVMDVKQATTLSSVFVVALMLAGGFFLQEIPGFIRWIKYLSFHGYAYKLLIKVQYSSDQKYNCSTPSGCQSISSSPAIHGTTLGGGGEEVWALIIMVIGYRVLAYLALRRMRT